MRYRSCCSAVLTGLLCIIGAAAILAPAALAQDASQRHALLIGGLGGTPEHSERFRTHLFETRRVLIEQAGYSANQVVVLSEEEGAEYAAGVSSAENVRAQFQRLAAQTGAEDQVLVILFGHGSFDGEHSHLNIPGRDLSDTDYASLLGELPAERIVFINTASASGPFAELLSAPNRIIITATRTGTQRNETVFPQFLTEAFSGSGDLNMDGNLSVGEVFAYVADRTAGHFEENNNVPTEHALLEDTGDGKAYRLEELEDNLEGNIAAVTYLRRGDAVLAQVNASPDSPLGRMIQNRERLERSVAELKSTKPTLSENEYYGRLETIFVELARLNDQIEQTAQ